MVPILRQQRRLFRPFVLRPFLVAMLLLAGLAQAAEAQPPPCWTISGFPPLFPPLPQAPPAGEKAIGGLVQHVSSTDASFEVILGQSRIIVFKEVLVDPKEDPAKRKDPIYLFGNPGIIFVHSVGGKMLRVIGLRPGVTDLTVVTRDEKSYTFEVKVVWDMNALRCQLKALFPDASLRLAQMNNKLVVEGQARDIVQVRQILDALRNLMREQSAITGTFAAPAAQPPTGGTGQPPQQQPPPQQPPPQQQQPPQPGQAAGGGQQQQLVPDDVINLIRVPGPQQVLLKVRVAELNRTSLRQIGADLFGHDPGNFTLGTRVNNAVSGASAIIDPVTGLTTNLSNTRSFFDTAMGTTVFGIFDRAEFAIFLQALRRNNILKILAEPNLMAINGHSASFLAGGEFPIPVPQAGGGGQTPVVTVQFRQFGVLLSFIPFVLDGDVIRLSVDPEVSNIDRTLSVTVAAGSTPVPGLNTRKAHTTVELRHGQTLAIAGLLQVTLAGGTDRIPGLGDLPILGPLFSNTTSERQEKELVVLVTPYIVEPMNADQVPPGPGDEVKAPNDLEFYLLSRIEGRTGTDWRATVNWDDPLHVLRCFFKIENDHVRGPHGFSD